MDIRLNDHFDRATLQRGRDYALRGLVISVEPLADGALRGRVSNGRGETYQQRIGLGRGLVDGICSCPVGHNCKHVVAALTIWTEQQSKRPTLAAPVQGWLSRIKETAAPAQLPETRTENYPDNVRDRLLYVLVAPGPKVKVDIYKGRINAAGSALNKSIRRYDALHALRSAVPAKFIRPVDLELLGALAQARLWETYYSYSLPELFWAKGEDVVDLIRRLCDTGRFLHDNAADAHLSWSDRRSKPRLGWRMAGNGNQRLEFEDEAGQPLELREMDGAALWIDTAEGKIGALALALEADVLRLVEASPEVAPHEAEALAAALPATLAGFCLLYTSPSPRDGLLSRMPSSA